MAATHVGFGTPFQEQVDYLLKKLNVPTERWDDIQKAAHDRAFMVAGAAKADLLNDLHQAINKAAAQGLGLPEFRKDFKRIVAKHGWTGWTGEGTKEGEAWRTKVIYQTNMAQSYWAGRYRQMSDPELLKLRPYWRYIHSDGVANPRPHHLAWHGLTLKADHPFWQTHFAPNGWGCRCRIEAVSQREGEASAAAGLDDLPADWDTIDPKTGTVRGIDKGFDYAPGAGVMRPLQELIDAKLIKLPPELADAIRADMDRMNALASTGAPPAPAPDAGAANVQAAAFVNAAAVSPRSKQPPLVLSPMSRAAIERAQQLGIGLDGKSLALDHDGVRHILKRHGGKDEIKRGQVPITALDIANWAQIFNAASLAIGDPPFANDRTMLISGEVTLGGWRYGFAAKVRRLDVVPLTLFKRRQN